MKRAAQPLCSDAFTNFQKYDSRALQLDEAVRRETNRLHQRIIPRVAQHLRQVILFSIFFSICSEFFCVQILCMFFFFVESS